jgi:hypothetical protein
MTSGSLRKKVLISLLAISWASLSHSSSNMDAGDMDSGLTFYTNIICNVNESGISCPCAFPGTGINSSNQQVCSAVSTTIGPTDYNQLNYACFYPDGTVAPPSKVTLWCSSPDLNTNASMASCGNEKHNGHFTIRFGYSAGGYDDGGSAGSSKMDPETIYSNRSTTQYNMDEISSRVPGEVAIECAFGKTAPKVNETVFVSGGGSCDVRSDNGSPTQNSEGSKGFNTHCSA